MSELLPPRPADGHKGTFGRVLIIAGSPGMSGAACLAATAALRSGSGLVTAAVPESIQSIVAGYEPSYLTAALPCGPDGQLMRSAADVVDQLIPGMDAVAVGPGLGRGDAAVALVESVITQTEVPLIIDADALNIVAERTIDVSARAAPTIVTPHPGEFVRLTGHTADDIRNHRTDLAREYAESRSVVVVLKGPRTVVTNGDHVYENSTGNSGMATGGTGDVLTGIIASLCGQKMAPYDAAVSAVYAHGLAGDCCAAATSEQGMIASDLLQWLPKAWDKMV